MRTESFITETTGTIGLQCVQRALLQNVLKASNRNDDPSRIRWMDSDLIGFTNKMKNIKAETDIT